MTFITQQSNLKTSFGDLLTESKTPKVGIMFPYNINTEQVETFTTTNGSVTQSDGKALVQVTGANEWAQISSRDVLKYVPGLGAASYFTSILTVGVSGSTQVQGPINAEDGFGFGYNETSYGLVRRDGGRREVQELTITGEPTSSGNYVITLDGVTINVAILDADTIKDVVDKIIIITEFNDAGWTPHKVDNSTIRFIAFKAEDKTGIFNATGQGITSNVFVESIQGVTPTDTWTTQANWNIDSMDGTGPSGQTITNTFGNVLRIQHQFLGFGDILYSIENKETGRFQDVHIDKFANSNTSPSIANPTLPLSIIVENITNTSNIRVETSSMAGFVEGQESANSVIHGAVTTSKSSITAETCIVGIHNKQVYQNKHNRVTIHPELLTVAVEAGTKSVDIRIRRDADINGTIAWVNHSTNTSVVETDTGGTTINSGTILFAVTMTKGDSFIIDLTPYNFTLYPASTWTISAESSNSTEVSVGLNWVEKH